MAGAVDTVEVSGIKELLAAFRKADSGLAKRLRAELAIVADPVKVRAQELAGSEITNMLSQTALVDWWKMRIGFTGGGVYVAPQERGIKAGPGKRPNLARLLLEKAMNPALEQSTPEILAGLDRMLEKIAAEF